MLVLQIEHSTKGCDGKGEGGHKNVQCFLISGASDSKRGVLCYQFKARCIFSFSFLFTPIPTYMHTDTSIRKCSFVGTVYTQIVNINEAHPEVFEKTLGFYCAMISRGCYDLCQEVNVDEIFEDSTPEFPVDSRSLIEDTCKGRIILSLDSDHAPILR